MESVWDAIGWFFYTVLYYVVIIEYHMLKAALADFGVPMWAAAAACVAFIGIICLGYICNQRLMARWVASDLSRENERTNKVGDDG